MKRLLTLALAATIVTSAFAQTSFTIRRPVDGSKVRETVGIRFPQASLPDGDYVGVYIDDKFVEAAMPVKDGTDYVYQLDTKARQLTDGPHKIELVLFHDFGSGAQPRITNRTSITVVVDNYSSIKVPEDGFDFRYKFVKGQELKYDITETQSISLVSQALAQVQGNHAPTRTTEVEHARLMYATDNVYDVKDPKTKQMRKEALLRIQPLPYKGRDYAILTVNGETTPRRFYGHEMHPIYMRVDDKGQEVFSSVPFYVPLSGTSGESFRTDLFMLRTPPVLPLKPRKPGESFPGSYQLSELDLEQMHEVKKITEPLGVRCTLMGVEWYRGIPVAKLMYNQAVGREDLKNAKDVNAIEGEAIRIEIEQYVYFDIAKGRVIRVDTNFVQSMLVDVTQGGGNGGGVSNNGGGSATPPGEGQAGPAGNRGGRGGGTRGGGGGAGGAAPPPGDFFLNRTYQVNPLFASNGQLVSLFRLGQEGAANGGGGGQGASSDEGGPSRGPGFTGNGNNGGGGPVTVKQILTIRSSSKLELEM
jgi:hypothetical protein